MTRRIVYFHNTQSGRYYLSPEFNGDRDELEQSGSADTCEYSWENILALFTDNTAAHHFMRSVATAMSCYHSQIPDPLPGVRIKTVHSYEEVPMADEVYGIESDTGTAVLDRERSISCISD